MTSEIPTLTQRLTSQADWLTASGYDEIASDMHLAIDKIEGLEADLRLSVLTAYNRGATEWAARNYPQWIDWLRSSNTLITGKEPAR